MPYKRKYAKKRYTNKSKVATKAYVMRTINKNIENKRYVQYLTNNFTSIGTTWVESFICNPAAGVGEDARIGRMINITSIELYGILVGGQTNNVLDDVYNKVRIIIALWDIEATASSPYTPLKNNNAQHSLPMRKGMNYSDGLIKKYYDKYITLVPNGQASDGYIPATKVIKYYKKFKKPIKQMWMQDVANYPSTCLILSVITDSTTVPNPGFTWGYTCASYQDA